MERRTGWVLLVLAIAWQGVVAVFDGKVPNDPARHLTAVAPLTQLLAEGRLGEALGLAWQNPGGGYSLSLAVGQVLLGPTVWVQKAANLFWFSLSGLAVLQLARAWVRSPALPLALLLLSPGFWFYHRVPWIHAPETAGVLLLAWLLVADPRQERVHTTLFATLLGFCVASLRPSGVVWLATTLPLLIPARARPARLVPVLAGWAAGVAVSARFLGEYLAVKGGAPHALGPWLTTQWLETWGWLGTAVVLVALLGLRARGSGTPRPALALTVGAWVLGPLLLMAFFRTGSRDFLLWAPGLALLAGRVEVGRAWPLLFAPLVLQVGADLFGPPTRARVPIDGEVVAWHRPAAGPTADRLRALVASSCEDPCHLLAPEGLLASLDDELGNYELFQLGLTEVELRALGDHPREGWERWGVDAMVAWDCPAARETWLPHFPGLPAMEADLAEELGLSLAWAEDAQDGCTWSWLTAGRPLDVPSSGATLPFEPARFRGYSEALYLRDPSLRQKRWMPPRAAVHGPQR